MQVNTGKGRIIDNESAQVKQLRGQVEKLERVVEYLKKHLPPEPVVLNEGAKPHA